MKNILLVVLVIVVLGAGGYWYMKNYPSSAQPATPAPTTTVAPTSGTSGSTGADTTMGTKEVAVSGNEFAFSPKTLTMAKGETMKVTFTNTGKYPHNFVINELNVQSKTVQSGQSDVVTFTADKAGTFEYYCSVPTHKDKGMVGTLTVQ